MKASTSIEDFRTIVRGLKSAYPREDFIPNEYTFNLWYAALKDIDYSTLNRAAQSYILSNKFPPAISDIRQLAYDLEAPAEEIAAEEWVRLMKALGHVGSPEAFDYWQRLPETTREIVGGYREFVEWANVPTVTLMSVQRPMFIKRFEEISKKKRLTGSIPKQLRTDRKQLEAYTPPAIEAKDGPVTEKTPPPPGLIDQLRKRLMIS